MRKKRIYFIIEKSPVKKVYLSPKIQSETQKKKKSNKLFGLVPFSDQGQEGIQDKARPQDRAHILEPAPSPAQMFGHTREVLSMLGVHVVLGLDHGPVDRVHIVMDPLFNCFQFIIGLGQTVLNRVQSLTISESEGE